MDEKFDIQAYMTRGVEKIVADSLKATLRDPRESAFMVKLRRQAEKLLKSVLRQKKQENISRLS